MTYKEKAKKIKQTLDLLDYDLGLWDPVNFKVTVILACAVKEIEDHELDGDGEMLVGCESDLISDRISDAFFDRRLGPQFIEELERREEYEFLAELKKVLD